ncbi:MAG: helix-turn-helix domain-containing protein [Gammaproteobacteria bacterium]|nr:MAG: helix-turn-helix domain-containing protein [Gammaproteobacteria bacterium]
MLIRKMRLDKGWSQEHLSEISGLSVRTIQRIERGQKPSLESLKSLAAVFEVDVAELSQKLCPSDQKAETEKNDEPQEETQEIPMSQQQPTLDISEQETETLQYVKDIRGFYSHVIKYVVIMTILLAINLLTTPGKLWVIWPALGWGIGLIMHASSVYEIFNFFGPKWERKQFKKRMKNK